MPLATALRPDVIHQPIVIRRGRLILVLGFVWPLVFTLFSGVIVLSTLDMLSNPTEYPGAVNTFRIVLVIFLFLLAISVIYLVRLLSPQPVILAIDEEGIHSRRSFLNKKVDTVRWDEIAYIGGYRVQNTVVGQVFVHERGRQSFFPRNGRWPGERKVYPSGVTATKAISFSDRATRVNYPLLIQMIYAQYPDRLQQYQIYIARADENFIL